ncbi:MAG TPA: hypothetical protein VGF30_09635 [Bacteroidia bacterium]
MKKKLFLAAAFLALASVVFVACKKEDNSGVSVGYSQDKGTGNNPNASSTGSTTTASTT